MHISCNYHFFEKVIGGGDQGLSTELHMRYNLKYITHSIGILHSYTTNFSSNFNKMVTIFSDNKYINFLFQHHTHCLNKLFNIFCRGWQRSNRSNRLQSTSVSVKVSN
jgi:hypothetical protein